MRTLALIILLAAVGAAAAAPRPDFGLVFNDDADLAFVDPDRARSEQLLRARIAARGAAGIHTLAFCVGMGGDLLYYPTRVASPVGWRKSPDEAPGSPMERRIAAIRSCLAAGGDAVRTAGEAARAAGMRFIPSLRMNDAHFMVDPDRHAMTSEFWFRHRHEYTIRESPLAFQPAYGNLLDYSHAAVRQLRLDTVREVLDRNRDLVDGFELDFNRFQVFFPRGRAGAGAPLMSELVREVRRRLDDLAREVGRPLHLFVRIPPSLDDCAQAGLEVERWIREGWVDLVSPSQLMTLAGDMPIADLAALTRRHGVRLHPSLYPRTSWRIPFPAGGSGGYAATKVGREATLEELRGAADGYRGIGADGFYLFNFTTAFGEDGTPGEVSRALVRELADPSSVAGAARVLVVTKSYYHDGPGSYAYAKALPARLAGASPLTLELVAGEIPSGARALDVRVGVRGLAGGARLGVTLNGRDLGPAQARIHVRSATGAAARQPDAAEDYLHFVPVDSGLLRRGANRVELRAEEGAAGTVTDLEVRLGPSAAATVLRPGP